MHFIIVFAFKTHKFITFHFKTHSRMLYFEILIGRQFYALFEAQIARRCSNKRINSNLEDDISEMLNISPLF